MIGSTIDQFKVLEVLGENAVTSIYLTEHTQTGGRFVLEAIKPELTGNAEFKQRMMADIVQLIKLEHPNIISPTNLLEVENRYYLVREHEEGQTLAEMLASQGGKLALDGVIRIFKDILRGFGYAHNEGLVHVLVTPESILINTDGEAKIIGFGAILQRELERRSSEKEKTSFARYFPPERFNYPESTDIRTNIYSLGGILFQMVTGRPPFEAGTIFELEMAHSQDVVDDPKMTIPALPQGISDAIMKALSKKPEDRFQTALEFYKELEKVESMRRSELFEDDFVKGFGAISGMGESGPVVMEADSSAQSFDLGSDDQEGMSFDLPEDDAPKDLYMGATVRDENVTPDMFKMPSAADPQPSAAAPADSGLEDWEKDFDQGLAAGSSISESTPGDFNIGSEGGFDLGSESEDSGGGFDFGNLESQTAFGDLGDLGADLGGFGAATDQQETVSAPSEAGDGPPDDFAFDDMGASIELDGALPTMSDETKPETGGFAFESDDGAFAFEHEEEPMPEVRRSGDGLRDSLEAADRTPGLRMVTVRQTDRRWLYIAVVLVVVVLGAGFLFWKNSQNDKRFRAEMDEIQQLVTSNYLEKAKSRLDAIKSSLPDKFEAEHTRLMEQIIRSVDQIKNQVVVLEDRAREFEREENFLIDGVNDAIGTYIKISELQPSNEEAVRAIDEIKKGQLTRAHQLLDEGNDIEALRLFAALRKALPDDADIGKKYSDLRSRLVKEKAGVLQAEINQLMQEKRYDNVPPKYSELRDIEPNSDFLKQVRPTLVDSYQRMAIDAQARQDYDVAVRYLKYCLIFDPSAKKIQSDLETLEEEAFTYSIQKTADDLDDASMANDYSKMYNLASKLNNFDPGNPSANTVLIRVTDHVNALRAEAERQQELGQFKDAAKIYRNIYEIRGDNTAHELWRKYEGFTPPSGMSLVPGGRFKMGYSPEPAARPAHDVSVSPIFIDTYEVTNAEFKKFVDANSQWRPASISDKYHDGNYLRHWENGAPRPGSEQQPVRYVSWYAASAYAKWAGKRLPTEAEWELAATGGASEQKYWWGNYSDAKMAIYEFYPPKRPGDVGSFPENPYGIYEILGNVSEWVQDTFSLSYYYESRDAQDPLFEGPGEKVYRGGSFRNRGRDVTVYKRFSADAKSCLNDVGFRCVRKAKLN